MRYILIKLESSDREFADFKNVVGEITQNFADDWSCNVETLEVQASEAYPGYFFLK